MDELLTSTPGDVLSRRYRLVAPIAHGGMAEVWEAEDEILGRRVAVKILLRHLARDDVLLERFRREAVAAARLMHPGIVATFDTGSEQGCAYIVMEYVAGKNLREVLDERGRLTVPESVTVTRQVAAALGYAHGAGLVHRDIKPANILLVVDDHDGIEVKVTDFGIAKAGYASGVDLTRTGIVLGTPKYVSPEQIRGEQPDGRTDLYSLGVVLYEMLVGAPPFSGPNDMATAMAHLKEKIPKPSSTVRSIPGALDRLVVDLLAKRPERRVASADVVERRLADIASELPRGRKPGGFGSGSGFGPGFGSSGRPAALGAPARSAAAGSATPGSATPGSAARSTAPTVAPSIAPIVASTPVPSPPTAPNVAATGRVGPPPPPPVLPEKPGIARVGHSTLAHSPLAPLEHDEGDRTRVLPASNGLGGGFESTSADSTSFAVPLVASPTTQEIPVAPPGSVHSRSRRRERRIGLLVLALLAVGAFVAARLLSAGRSPLSTSPPTSASQPTGSVSPTSTVKVIGIRSVSVYMVVPGHPADNPQDVANTIAGSSATPWSTDIYATPTFGGLYSGIGLSADLGSSHKLGYLQVTSSSVGWSGAVYASDKAIPSGQPASAWGQPLSTATGVSGSHTFSLGGHYGRYVLFLITNLGPSDRTEVARLKVY